MKTEILSSKNPQSISRAISILNQGGLVAFPTDTVYGVAASFSTSANIEKLYQAKNRNRSKAIAVLMSSAEQLPKVAVNIPKTAWDLTRRFWPGPLTVILNRNPQLPDNLAPGSTLGVRVPNQPDALALMDATGPLAVTSANLSGGENTCSASEVLAQLKGRIDLILDGGTTPGGTPSTVVDCTTEKLKILRVGPITEEDLQKAFSQPNSI